MGTGASAGGVLIEIIVCRCNALIRCARLRHRSPLLISLGFCPCAKPRSVGADNSCIVVAVGRPLLPPFPSPPRHSVEACRSVGVRSHSAEQSVYSRVHFFPVGRDSSQFSSRPSPLLSTSPLAQRDDTGYIQTLSLHSQCTFPLSSSILLRSFSGLEKLLLALFYRMG